MVRLIPFVLSQTRERDALRAVVAAVMRKHGLPCIDTRMEPRTFPYDNAEGKEELIETLVREPGITRACAHQVVLRLKAPTLCNVWVDSYARRGRSSIQELRVTLAVSGKNDYPCLIPSVLASTGFVCVVAGYAEITWGSARSAPERIITELQALSDRTWAMLVWDGRGAAVFNQ